MPDRMEQVAVEGMADILPPPPPNGTDYLFPGLLLSMAMVTILLWVWRQRWPYPNLRRLQKLTCHYQAGRLDTRQVADRLSHEIKQGFHLSHVTQYSPPAIIQAQDWARVIQTLQAARFAAPGQTDIDLLPLIKDTQQWLTRHSPWHGR